MDMKKKMIQKEYPTPSDSHRAIPMKMPDLLEKLFPDTRCVLVTRESVILPVVFYCTTGEDQRDHRIDGYLLLKRHCQAPLCFAVYASERRYSAKMDEKDLCFEIGV